MHGVIRESIQWKMRYTLATYYLWCYFDVFLCLNRSKREVHLTYKCFALQSLWRIQVQMLHWWLERDQECGNDMQMFAISKSWWYPVTFTSPSLLLFSQNVHVRVWLQRCWARSFSLCRFKGLFAKGCIPPTEPSLLSQPPHNHLCQKQLKKTKQQIC